MSIYHEKQRRYYCGLHTVNNILQRQVYHEKDFEDIAAKLYGTHQTTTHSSRFFNWGYYDINVIWKALALQNYDIKWAFTTSSPSSLSIEKTLVPDINEVNKGSQFIGLIVHIQRSRTLKEDGFMSTIFYKLTGSLQEHFYTILRVYDVNTSEYCWYNLDSTLTHPVVFNSLQRLTSFIKAETLREGAQLHILQVYKLSS